MTKRRARVSLGAADCARRVGLTVRALRVYERYGLITPQRSVRGWRLYGLEELKRLNAILALKRLGMTLSQIRQALSRKMPEIGHALRVQLETSRARKATTDELIRLIELVLSKIRDRQDISIHDLNALMIEQPDDRPAIATARR